ncbi:MAG: helix-turn-helix transcriptional regulator [Clostridia bacterium]|nr:helix-turn-helix transcriptional regulator [Clostridia bacterium]
MNFSKVLKMLMREKGVSQATLANVFNTTQQTISRWLNQINEPDIKTIVGLAEYFDCSVDFLLGRENDYGVLNSGKPKFNDKQTELLSSFNLLPDDEQNKVLGYIKALR